jgi:Fic family protein
VVSIKKKKKENHIYYYLRHSIRKGPRKIETTEKYLGVRVPRNIEQIKQEFLKGIHKKKWYPLFDQIKSRYSADIRLMPPSSREKELKTFATKFIYHTQKIEGSKLTLRETANLLDRGLTPKEKPLEDIVEAKAHDNLFFEIMGDEKYYNKKDLSYYTMLEWHRKLFHLSKPDIAGLIRKHQTAISGSKFVPPLPVEVYPLLREFFRWYGKNKSKIHPVELSALVHLKIVTVHPFADGNGRISRLMMNFVLRKKGYPLVNIPYEGRNSYYSALERSQINKTENSFVQWFMKRYVKENDTYLPRTNVAFTMFEGKVKALK